MPQSAFVPLIAQRFADPEVRLERGARRFPALSAMPKEPIK